MPGEHELVFHSRRVFGTAVELDILTTPHSEGWGEHLRDDHIWGRRRVRRGGRRRGREKNKEGRREEGMEG